jgi:predicted transcriptional regulator
VISFIWRRCLEVSIGVKTLASVDGNLENEGIEKLFFELASGSRLGILHILQNENLKMQEIARRLDVTATEAFRQLERLSAALLVKRQPDGAFAIEEYGKLVLQLSSSLEFVSKHKDYFSTHDIMRLPIQFVNRIGELSQTSLIMDTMESINRSEHMFLEAKRFAWGLAEGVIPELMDSAMNEQARRGIKMQFIIPENRLPTSASPPEITKTVEVRGLPDIPAIIALTEKEAAISLRLIGGRMDYASFYGKDPVFHNFAKDMFLYYWDKGKKA